MRRFLFLSGVAAVAMSPFAISSASAQETAEDQAARENPNTIIVTARKQEETLLDIPLAVTALTDEFIEDADIQNTVDVARFTPGLTLEGFNSIPGRYDSVPFVRGVVFDSTDALRQTVSLFVDGMFVSGGNQMISLDNLQRVEVIKGPQSAQFGRSTFAGAINYITKDPSRDFEGSISGLIATRDEYEIKGSLEGPIAGDVLRARVSARYNFNGGHHLNLANPVQPGQELGEESTFNLSAQLLFEPSPMWRTKINAMYTEIDDGPAAAFAFPIIDVDGPLPAGAPAGAPRFADQFGPNNTGELFPFGRVPDLPASLQGLNTDDARFDAFIAGIDAQGANLFKRPDRFGTLRDGFRINSTTEIDFDDDFGARVSLGYAEETAFSLQDFDSQPADVLLLYAGRHFEDFQAEASIFGSLMDDRLNFSIGANYYGLDYETNGAFSAFGQSSAFGNLGEVDFSFVDTTGIFGLLSFDLTDSLTISAEGRYQWDKIDETVTGDPTTSVVGSPTTFKNFLPRVIVEYSPTPDVLLYASYSEGNLPGGFNSGVAALTPEQLEEARQQFAGISTSYGEETLKNYEVGLKIADLFDGRGNLAFSAYYMERVGQVTSAVVVLTNPGFFDLDNDGNPDPGSDPNPIVTQTFRVNEAASEIKGLELEANFYPTSELSMRATLAYTNAEISDFPPTGDSGDYEDVFLSDEGFIGRKAERYPDWQATFSSTYETPVGDFLGPDTSWYARGDLTYSSEYFLSTPNLGTIEPTTIVDVRSGLRSEDMSFELFVTNLFGDDSPTTGNNYNDYVTYGLFAGFRQDGVQIGLRDKRQFGARLSYSF